MMGCQFKLSNDIMTTAPISGGNYNEYVNLIEEIQHNSSIPEVLYHYTSAEGLNGILQSHELRLTRWDSLNDVSENVYIHDVIRECIHEMEADESFKSDAGALNQTILSSKHPHSSVQIDKNMYVASFSKNDDCLPLWTYYTKSAQSNGYCIGFNSDSFSFKGTSFSMCGVIYNRCVQKQLINKFLQHFFVLYNADIVNGHINEGIKLSLVHAFSDFVSSVGCLFKHPSFEYEEEIRVLARINAQKAIDEKRIKIRCSNGILIPYIAMKFERSGIKCVKSSPTLDAATAYNGIRTAQTLYKYPRFEIEHSSLPLRNI